MKLVISATPQRANFAPILLQGDIEEAFAKAAQLGYQGIELHLRDPHEIDWDKTLAMVKQYSLPVTALGTGAGARVDGLTFTDLDVAVRKRTIERVAEHIKFAALLDASIIIGSMNGHIAGNQIAKEYHLDCLKQCCELGAKDKVTILLEPLNRYESDWLNNTQDTLEIIAKAEYPNIKYLADTFHMNIEEASIIDSLKSAGNNLGYVHLVDSNRQIPGNGHILFDQVLKTLADMKFTGPMSFECLPAPDSKTASAAAIKYVKNLM